MGTGPGDEPRPKRVTKRRAETLRRLPEDAVDVFADRGLRGAGIEEVRDRTGCTRGAFYSGFGTLDELLLTVAEDHLQRMLEEPGLLEVPDGPDGEEGGPAKATGDTVMAATPDGPDGPDGGEGGLAKAAVDTVMAATPDGGEGGLVEAAGDIVMAATPDDRRWWPVEAGPMPHEARDPEGAASRRPLTPGRRPGRGR